MKLTYLLPLFALIIFGCQSVENFESLEGEVLILEYCSGDEYLSDSKHFRSSATGESPNRETAKKIAYQNAESQIARSISAVVEMVAENQATQIGFNSTEEATSKFNEFSRTIVNQQLVGAVAICNQLTQKSSGEYVYYLSLELSGDKLASKYFERLSQEEIIRAEYNYDQFKETFEEVMSSYR